MKKFLALALMILSTSSFATCFTTSDEAALKAGLPQVICVNSQEVSLVVPELPAEPSYKVIIDTDLGVVEQNNVRFKPFNDLFTAKVRKSLRSEGGFCSRTRNTYLEFTLNVKADLEVYELSVTGFDVTNPDVCHSNDRVKKFEYSVI